MVGYDSHFKMLCIFFMLCYYNEIWAFSTGRSQSLHFCGYTRVYLRFRSCKLRSNVMIYGSRRRFFTSSLFAPPIYSTDTRTASVDSASTRPRSRSMTLIQIASSRKGSRRIWRIKHLSLPVGGGARSDLSASEMKLRMRNATSSSTHKLGALCVEPSISVARYYDGSPLQRREAGRPVLHWLRQPQQVWGRGETSFAVWFVPLRTSLFSLVSLQPFSKLSAILFSFLVSPDQVS